MPQPSAPKLDIIGDLHGEHQALLALLGELGYERDTWTHPEGRKLLFVGDLVDRGPHSLEVAKLVHRLCISSEALCLLGNHELNLIEWRHGRQKPKHSNERTIKEIEASRAEWMPLLDFFETLPVALELPDLRVTHAAWHQGCFDELAPVLTEPATPSLTEPWKPYVRLHAPYENGKFRSGISKKDYPGQEEPALPLFVKGHESAADEEFIDNDNKKRSRVCAEWWRQGQSEVPSDKRIIFGHYWNMPPVDGAHDAFVPPHPSGHPRLREWFNAEHDKVPARGRRTVPEHVRAVCIDYNGVTRAGARACAGAYRYPEAEVAWVAVPKQ